jgi:hypothetical protein
MVDKIPNGKALNIYGGERLWRLAKFIVEWRALKLGKINAFNNQ